jgi:transcriptional regulator with XRE-family HTH domain
MLFYEKVIFVRAKLNLSQEALAKKLDVSFATVNRWEHGRTIPTRKTEYAFNEFCKENHIVLNEELGNE